MATRVFCASIIGVPFSRESETMTKVPPVNSEREDEEFPETYKGVRSAASATGPS